MEPLYRQGYRTFLRVATAVVVEEARGADLVQEAFVRAIASRSSFRGDAPLEAWVWRIVLNSARAARPTGEARLPTTLAAATDTGSSEPDRYGVDAWLTALPERERARRLPALLRRTRLPRDVRVLEPFAFHGCRGPCRSQRTRQPFVGSPYALAGANFV